MCESKTGNQQHGGEGRILQRPELLDWSYRNTSKPWEYRLREDLLWEADSIIDNEFREWSFASFSRDSRETEGLQEEIIKDCTRQFS